MSQLGSESNGNIMTNDEPVYNTIIKKGVWSPRALKVIGILFFSLLSTSIFYIINYSRLDHPQKKSRIKYLVLGTIFYLILMIVLPNTYYVTPIFLVANIVLGIIISNDQKPLYEEYIKNGGKKNSTILLVFLTLLVFLAFLLIDGGIIALKDG